MPYLSSWLLNTYTNFIFWNTILENKPQIYKLGFVKAFEIKNTPRINK